MSASKLDLVLESVKTDDHKAISMYLSSNPELFESATDSNPLLVACKYGSFRVAKEIARKYPHLLGVKNEKGSTVLHMASSGGNLALVEVLLEHDRELCRQKDKNSRIPLQTAVRAGYSEVIRKLIDACPDTIQAKTSQKETLFHLAVKGNMFGAFQVLLEEVQRLKQEHLLFLKDRQGNSILHIAVSNKLEEVVKLLLPQNSTRRALVRVNTLNKKGKTALDLNHQNAGDISTTVIGRALKEAGGLEGRLLPMRAHVRWTLETKNVILLVLTVIIGAAFTAVCNLPRPFQENNYHMDNKEFQVIEMLSHNLPNIFYLMVFNTVIVIVCIAAIIKLLWSLPFRPVVLFVTVNVGIVYGLLVKNILPKFFFRISTLRISSFYFVILWAAAIISAGVIAYLAFSCFRRFIKFFTASDREN